MAQSVRPAAVPVRPASGPGGPASQGLLDNVMANAKPIVIQAMRVLDAAGPIIQQTVAGCQTAWRAIQPYHPDDWWPLLAGFLLIFYGGVFPVTIAAIEAFRICGWTRTKASLQLLYQQYTVALEVSRKDDLLDENNDGIPDVLQIDNKTLVSRKVGLFLRCTDPKALNEGIQGIAAGCSAVMATLRVHFAHTLTLGVALGDIFIRTADTVLRPALEKVTPREYHKWLGMVISYGCRCIAVTIAWWCTRIISAMHSATRGSQLMLWGITKLAARHNVHIPIDLSSSNPIYPIVCGTVGAIGLYYQLARGFALPFPFNLLLLPLRLVEWLLYYCLAYTNYGRS